MIMSGVAERLRGIRLLDAVFWL
ncbi:MAG: hypothetical protein K0S05_1312, partial [Agromyces sp.]|nr:hypothetical protein [Agromyces sp.]